LWIIRSGHTELEEIKGTRSAIGGFTEENQDFETHEIKLNKGDTFYMFSDGYLDQFGGERRKKLNKKQFKELLISIQNLSMEEQGAALDQFISEYRKDIEQTDDILVMGIKM
jgi:serine phosphatase RsbU (regulator of sigma subunit)